MKQLQKENPKLRFCTKPNIRAKLILVNGKHKIVWSSSQNFGSSTWTEDTLNLKSNDASVYNFFKTKLVSFLKS